LEPNYREKYAYEYRAEKFYPPYYFSPNRPNITSLSVSAVGMGRNLTVSYTGTVTHAVLMKPSAVTHQSDMGQRGVKLVTLVNTAGKITVKMPPPGGLVATAAYYMLFLLNRDVPCVKAQWVQLLHVNDTPPIAVPDAWSTTMNTPITIYPLANDRDVDDGNWLSFHGWVILPKLGKITHKVGAEGFSYLPMEGVTGVDKFSYRVFDNFGKTASGQITITIGELNSVVFPTTICCSLRAWLCLQFRRGNFTMCQQNIQKSQQCSQIH
jgi:hypothetical protein